MIKIFQVIDERRVGPEADIYWPARWEWSLHLATWLSRDKGMRN